MQHITPRFFNQLVAPLLPFVPALCDQFQADFGYRKFFTLAHVLLSVYAHLSKAEAANDLIDQLNDQTLAVAEMVGHSSGSIATSSFSRANASRPYQIWQTLFVQLYKKVSPHFKQLHLGGLEGLNEVRLVDGTLFKATSAMLWASYRTTKNKLKGHFFLDLNGLPDKLIVSDGKASERAVLAQALIARVTYVFDRGYNSYELFAQVTQAQAYFVTRLLSNANYVVVQNLNLLAEEAQLGLGADQLITVKVEDGTDQTLRLVTFQTDKGEIYQYLTNRLDLSALTIVRLYLWRWEIELLFAWLKRHLVFHHWYSENENGVRIQLFAGLMSYLLLRLYGASQGEAKLRIGWLRKLRRKLTEVVSVEAIKAYELDLETSKGLIYCFTFCLKI